MSDRYEQPGYNSYIDDWHTPLNRNFSNIGDDIEALEAGQSNHIADTTNPHAVTAAQAGAPTQTEFDTHTGDTTNPHSVTAAQVSAPTQSEFDTHIGDTANPHAVTAAQAGALPDTGGTLTGGLTVNGSIESSSSVSSGGGFVCEQRGAPTTTELADGARMQYTSDGTDGNAAGDLVSARNNAGTIVSQVIAPASNDA